MVQVTFVTVIPDDKNNDSEAEIIIKLENNLKREHTTENTENMMTVAKKCVSVFVTVCETFEKYIMAGIGCHVLPRLWYIIRAVIHCMIQHSNMSNRLMHQKYNSTNHKSHKSESVSCLSLSTYDVGTISLSLSLSTCDVGTISPWSESQHM